MSKLKYFIGIALVLGFAAFIVFSPGPPPIPVEGYAAPDFELRDAGGKTYSLGSLRGSVVLLNFWASWCPPCKEELPSLNRLHESSSDNPSLVILTILYRDDPKKGADFFKENGYTLPMLLDPGDAVAERYGLTGVPETFFIDREGVLRKWIKGPLEFDSPNVMRFIENLLATQA